MAKNGHTETNSDESALTPQQLAAVDLLAAGRTVTQAADALEIARQTVSQWLNQHCGFQAALNERRQELWDTASDKLRNLLPTALEVLESELANGKDKVNAAALILKSAGLSSLSRPSGPVTAKEVKLDRDFQQHQKLWQAVAIGMKAKQD